MKHGAQKKAAWIFLFILLAFTAITRAKIAGADNPKAYTEHDYRKQLLDFNLRTLVEQYKQVGHHDAKWDDDATRFLTGIAKYFASAGAQNRYRLPEVPQIADLVKQGRQVLKSGCDDPLVLDMFSIVLLDSREMEEYRPLARQAVDALVNSQYSVARATNSARRALRHTDPKTEKDLYDRYDQSLFDGDLAIIGFSDFPESDRRFIFKNVEDELQRWPLARAKSFFESAKTGKGDIWLIDTIGGEYHIRAAWAARGGGWANTVTPEGWRKFEEEIAAAHKCLNDAYNVAPAFPESATKMLTVAMAESDRDALRTWFDRATEAQLDYLPAYNSYLYAIYPRWLGNYPEMYSFALECAATGRYDTCVPYFYLDALTEIRNDMGGNWHYSQLPASWEKIVDVLSNYAEHDAAIGDREYYYSQLIGYAWQLAKYTDGRAALDKIDGKYNLKGMSFTPSLPMRTVSGTYAFTGPSADTLKKAEADVAAGRVDGAIEAYTSLARETKPDDRAARWMHSRAQELKWKKSFDAGEWVDFMGSNDLAGFEPLYGKFTRDDKGIVGVADQYGSALLCPVRFGSRWQTQAKVEALPPAPGKPIPRNSDGGLIFGWLSAGTCYAVLPRPASKELVWIEGSTAPWTGPISCEGQPTIKINMWDGQVDVTIDACDFLSNRRTFEWTKSPSAYIGLGSSAAIDSTYRITEFKIKKLDQEPAHATSKE